MKKRKYNLSDYAALVTREGLLKLVSVIGNREIDQKHVKELYKVMQANPEAVWTGLIVNKRNNHIIDGQHRIKARLMFYENNPEYEDVPIGITYIDIPEEDEIFKIIQINTSSKSWLLSNYIQCYAQRGYTSYNKLIEFCDKNQLKFRYAIALVCGGNKNQMIKDGAFEASDYEFDMAQRAFNELYRIYTEAFKREISGCSTEAIFAAYSRNRSLLFSLLKNNDKSFDEYLTTIRNLSGLYDLDHPTTRKDAEKLFFTFAK